MRRLKAAAMGTLLVSVLALTVDARCVQGLPCIKLGRFRRAEGKLVGMYVQLYGGDTGWERALLPRFSHSGSANVFKLLPEKQQGLGIPTTHAGMMAPT